MVHPFVARNRVHPGRQGLVTLVGVALLVDRHQGFLHKVLDIAELGLHPFLQKAPHMTTHEAQGTLVTGVIALQGWHPCGVQFGFLGLQAFAQVSSSKGVKKLQIQRDTHSAYFLKLSHASERITT
jgi:hypothetical protein